MTSHAASKPLVPGSVIGIVGGGQLGRMIAAAAARLGMRTIVLDPQPDCPAGQLANDQIVAAYDDENALSRLASACAVVTYEFENVPVGPISALARQVPVRPAPAALDAAQDRLVEKTFLNGLGIATAQFRAVDDQAGLVAARHAFGGSGVLKTRRFGYDGKGQRVFRGPADDADGAFAAMGDVPLILESLVDFEREISVIAARSVEGAVAAYDPAENVHRDGILHTSTLPARISDATAQEAVAAVRKVLEALDYVGVIGVEFFVTADGGLVANEIAPRVHNSGHWTEAACLVSQFEQHVRAICGLPLGSTFRHANCMMENLIGDDVQRFSALLAEPSVMLTLYGKAEARPGRKMGHFTRILKS